MVSKWCCLYSVTSVRALGCFLCQWLPLLLPVNFTVNCQSKCLSHSSGCCAFALLLSIVLHGNCYWDFYVTCECVMWVWHVSVKSESDMWVWKVSVTCECEKWAWHVSEKWVSCECEKWAWHVSVTCECEKWEWHVSVTCECEKWAWHVSVKSECHVSVKSEYVMWVWKVSVSCECDMWMWHVILIINVHLSISCFSSILDICKFSFHYYRCWGADCLCSTISSDSMWRYTVNFPFLSSEIKIRHFHKVW